VVEHASEDPARLAVGARVWLDGEPAEIVERKVSGGRLVARLDRPVERGAVLDVPVEALPEPGEDEYYAFQLEGLSVEAQDGRSLGQVVSVTPGIANDVLELDTGLLLPMVEDCVLSVDLQAATIVVAEGFADEP
jgi:16S rRNA processing protein RimM